RSYRRRRLMDAARLLPVVGMFLFLLPLLWEDSATTTTGLFYVFGAWLMLIVAVFLVSRAFSRMLDDDESDGA
ncbi:MAG: hypothetical protein AAFN59_14140, partial [Pseudomonadota bacterium]